MKTSLILAGVSALALTGAAMAQPAATTTALPQPSGNTILIQHGQVHTLGGAGTLNNADVLIENGKIAQVGSSLAAPVRPASPPRAAPARPGAT